MGESGIQTRAKWLTILTAAVILYAAAYFCFVQKQPGRFHTLVFAFGWKPSSSSAAGVASIPAGSWLFCPQYASGFGLAPEGLVHSAVESFFFPAHWIDRSFVRPNEWSLGGAIAGHRKPTWWSVSGAP